VPDFGYDERARAHSVAAETAVDFGLLGLAVLVALVAVSARRLWQVLRHATVAHDAPALAAMAALGGLAVHLQVDYFLAYTQIAVFVWPLLGLACGAPLHATAEGPRDVAPAPPAPDPER
jgi:O-antigen ligase